MMGADHELASVNLAFSYLVLTQNPTTEHVWTTLGIVTATGVGALIPDLDSPNSLASQMIKIPLYKIFPHRGITHSWLGLGLFSLATYLLFNLIFDFSGMFDKPYHLTFCLWLGLCLGYFLHMLEDSWSQAGIVWCAPFSRPDPYSKSSYTTKRKVVRWGKNELGEKKIPIRHRWGRGYVVGSETETKIVGTTVILAVICLVIWVRRMF